MTTETLDPHEITPIEFERGGHHYSWQFTSSARGDRTHSSAHIFCTLERDGDNVSYQADVHQHGGGQRKFSGGYITLEWKHSLFDRENAQAKIPEAFPELQHQTSS